MGVQIQGDTGNVIATKGTYSGNVTIGGTLTYEDVTNIDSVGLITAREGIEVGARPGVAASISVDGNAIFSGIVTATSFVGDGTNLTNVGVDTAVVFTDKLSLGDNERVSLGIGSDLNLSHDSNNSIISNSTGELLIDSPITNLRDASNNSRLRIEPAGNVNVASNLKVAGVCTATSFSGSGAALTGISAGITEFDMWTLQTNHSADASSEILGVSGSSTLQRHTSMNNSVAQAAQIGTGMSFDSSTGIFTFPSTGKYLVINNPTISIHGNDNAGVMTRISTDGGSNFTTAALPYMGDSDGGMHSGISFNFVDVTNTSNIKVRFRQDSLGTNSYVVGNNGYARTVFIFARIGDT